MPPRAPARARLVSPYRLALACLAGWLVLAAAARAAEPLRLHPDNPRYFLFRGKPAILITSGEHYGAVLNQDFDYVRYLDELKANGLNLTRTFSGTYREVPGSFHIVQNTLAPARGKYLAPWARSATAGAADGGNKFDLTRWDAAYFKRLKDFLTQAGKRGIVVELSLFCTIYDEKLWDANPMKARNNVNGVGNVGRLQAYALKEDKLTAVQDALVRKIVTELKDFDNLYYEVCNEPYFGGVTRKWNDHIIATLVRTEKALKTRHLIAQNISNGSVKIDRPNKDVSVFNFHYSAPPDSVRLNYGLKRAVADDETGFRGTGDLPYRTEGWDFFLAGGAVYSSLDYSFTCSRPDGTFRVTTSPGGGGRALRRSLKVLKDFMEGFEFIKMAPHNKVVRGGWVKAPLTAGEPAQAAATTRVLAEPGKAYAIYVKGGVRAELVLDLPTGSYRAEWVNPKTGKVDKQEEFKHDRGRKTLGSPPYTEDIALRVKRVGGKR
jgi:hypothetical protein